MFDISFLRFKRGTILRILDSKEPEDKSIIASAPSILDFLTTQSAQRFTTVLKYLDLISNLFIVLNFFNLNI